MTATLVSIAADGRGAVKKSAGEGAAPGPGSIFANFDDLAPICRQIFQQLKVLAMPRFSAEARSATAYSAGGNYPDAPTDMSAAASEIWRKIVRPKPLGWFDAGSLVILRQYCETAVEAQLFAAMLDNGLTSPKELKDRMNIGKHLVRLNGNLTTMATKLRLSVQAAVDRRNRILDETGAEEKADDKLLGGTAVWGDKMRMDS